jgi:hypothetical protein
MQGVTPLPPSIAPIYCRASMAPTGCRASLQPLWRRVDCRTAYRSCPGDRPLIYYIGCEAEFNLQTLILRFGADVSRSLYSPAE